MRTVFSCLVLAMCFLIASFACNKPDSKSDPKKNPDTPSPTDEVTSDEPDATETTTTASTDSDTSSTLDADSDFLLTATEETAPVIGVSASLTQLRLTENDSPIYGNIYNTLRSWNPETDNGVVDMGNIYHVLDVAGDKYQQVSPTDAASCTTGTCGTQCKPAFDAALAQSCLNKDGPVSSQACDPLIAELGSQCPSSCESCFSGWVGSTEGGGGAMCEVFPTPKIVDSPYDFGKNEIYSCAVNQGKMGDAYPSGLASGQSGTNGEIKKLLAGFVWAGDGQDGEYCVIQGIYDSTAKNLDLNFAQLVTHGDSQFARRIAIIGNVEEHSFTIRSLFGPKDASSEGTWISMVGKGISQGNGNYFLLKIISNVTNWDTAKYLCFSADVTKAGLDALAAEKPNGDTTVDSNCAAYQAEVDAMTFFDKDNDMPHAPADFLGKGGSSILLNF